MVVLSQIIQDVSVMVATKQKTW